MRNAIGKCSQCGGMVIKSPPGGGPPACGTCAATVKQELPVLETEGGSEDASCQPGGGKVQQQWER